MKAIKRDLLKRFGGKCSRPGCGSTRSLEFAHIHLNGMKGQGRGSLNRYYDIKKNPGNYRLLCDRDHRLYDSRPGRRATRRRRYNRRRS